MDRDKHECAVCGFYNTVIGKDCVDCGYRFQSVVDWQADRAEQELEERMLHGDGDTSDNWQ